MTQKRTHDYHAPRTAKSLNDKFIDLLPAGIYRGFDVGADGVIQPGVLLSADGVRIEETEENTVSIPARDNVAYKRRDLVVCDYAYEEAETPPVAIYRVVAGVEAADNPSYPVVPDNCLVLAWCEFDPPATSEWSKVVCNFPNEKLINCAASSAAGQYSFTGYAGGSAARITFDSEAGTLNVQIVDNLDFEDGFEFGAPCAVFSSDGLAQVTELAGAGRTDETVKGVADLLTAVLGDGWTSETIMDAMDSASAVEAAFAVAHFSFGSLDEDGQPNAGLHDVIEQHALDDLAGQRKTLLRSVMLLQSQADDAADPRKWQEWFSNATATYWQTLNATWNQATEKWQRQDTTRPAYAIKNGREKFYRAAGSDTWYDSQWIVDKFAYVWSGHVLTTSSGNDKPALVAYAAEELRRNPSAPSYNNVIAQTLEIAAVRQDLKAFKIASEVDLNFDLQGGYYISVVGSIGNDRGYTVNNAQHTEGETWIYVNEAIPSDVADGYIRTWVFNADRNMILRVSASAIANINTNEGRMEVGKHIGLALCLNGEKYRDLASYAVAAVANFEQLLSGSLLVPMSAGDCFQIVFSHSADSAETLANVAGTRARIDIEEV